MRIGGPFLLAAGLGPGLNRPETLYSGRFALKCEKESGYFSSSFIRSKVSLSISPAA